MEQEFGRTLERLREPEPSRSVLFELTNLHGKALALLADTWPSLPVERRQEIISRLVEMTEADFEVDFSEVFKICLPDDDPQVRAAAIEGLWEVEDVTLIRPLVRALTQDSSQIVREAAAISLSRFARSAELGHLPARLADLVWDALWQAVHNQEEDLDVRRRAIESLAYFDRPEVTQVIERAYRDEESTMRLSAVFAMGRSADEDWSKYILDELQSYDPEMRFEAARACGELKLAGSVPTLSQMTADKDPEVKLAAVWSLGQIGGPESRRVLEICVKMGDEALQDAAHAALSEMDYLEEAIDLSLYDYDLDDEEEEESEEDELEDEGLHYEGFADRDPDDEDLDDEDLYKEDLDDEEDEDDYWRNRETYV
jgi:HEAT repeat protein